MTNYERINNMSVDEMADYLWESLECNRCPLHDKCGIIGSCKYTWLNWLNQEAEE